MCRKMAGRLGEGCCSAPGFTRTQWGRGHSPQEIRLGGPGSSSGRRPWEGRPAAFAGLPRQPGQVPGGLSCPDLVGWVGKAGGGLERAQALRAQPLQQPHDGNHTESRGRSWDSGRGSPPHVPPTPRPSRFHQQRHCLCLPRWQPHPKPPLPTGATSHPSHREAKEPSASGGCGGCCRPHPAPAPHFFPPLSTGA